MVLSRTDETELLTALHEGPHEEPRWATFLNRLLRRTGADHVWFLLRQGHVPAPLSARYSAGRPGRRAASHPDRLAALDAVAYYRLRPGRVYDAEELLDPTNSHGDRFRADVMERIGACSARFMRVTEAGGASAWLMLTRAAGDFSAADAALVSALAPHLTIALKTLLTIEQEQFRARTGTMILDRAGIGWLAIGEDQRVIDGTSFGRELRELEDSTYWLAVEPSATPPDAADLPARIKLARRAPALGHEHAAAFRRMFELSENEARLAVRIASGQSLAAAATALGLTIETGRSYSKSLFTKTGTRGQADLVRLLLTSIAPLA